MTEYTIAAIPTVYRGRTYRSRLEARWAAFFDRLRWTYEYEPFDLGSWSPDFLLPDLDTLVEVKPWTSLDKPTADKVADAAGDKQILLTMAAPVLVKNAVSLGWFLPQPVGDQWYHATMFWLPKFDQPQFKADLVYPADFPVNGRNIWLSASGTGGYTDEPSGRLHGYGSHTMKLWADACNAVQWEPGQ